VLRVDLDLDLQGWRPEAGMLDDQGNLILDRTYNQTDINKEIVFPERDKVVAQKISEFLHNTDPMNKTIVFCSNIDHAERMRQALVNEPLNAKLVAKDNRYVMRITGDNEEGKNELDNFIDPKRPYPVIATTSKLMSTGVDAQTCQLIVLDQKIQSMTEFKQIIGRGTRLRPDYGKYFFTIIDFKKATELFADPEWDGPAISIKEIDQYGNEKLIDSDPLSENEEAEIDEVIVGPYDNSNEESEPTKRFVVSGVQFKVIAERVQYYDKDGKLITESLRDFTRKAVGQEFKSLDQFIKRWNEADRKQAIVEELVEMGVILEALEEAVGRDLDAFDLICHIAFDQLPLTRKERAEKVKKRDVFSTYGDQARTVLGILLDKYADQGLETIEKIDVLRLDPFTKIGTPMEIVKSFGGREKYLEAVHKLETELYATSA
jgi:type I restriction enzyme R subunit